MSRNQEMYGDVDLEALAAAALDKLRADPNSMPPMISEMVAQAQDEMLHDIVAARQTLNQITFLIYRCCPYEERRAQPRDALSTRAS